VARRVEYESLTIDARVRVLFVDDNADVRQYVGRLLAPTYDVQLAADGEAALAAALCDPIHARRRSRSSC
jgi:PleD family two-component response regulator